MKTVFLVLFMAAFLFAQTPESTADSALYHTGQYGLLFSIDGLNVNPYYGIGGKYWSSENIAYFAAFNVNGSRLAFEDTKSYEYSLGITLGIEKYFYPERTLSPFIGFAISPYYK